MILKELKVAREYLEVLTEDNRRFRRAFEPIRRIWEKHKTGIATIEDFRAAIRQALERLGDRV